MIHYSFDLTENGYRNIKGNADNFSEMLKAITKENSLEECVGYIKTDAYPDLSICVCFLRDKGIFLGIQKGKEAFLSLADKDRLSETVDVWGDGLYVSCGLFVEEKAGLSAFESLLENGKPGNEIMWTSPSMLPEEGNYII